jgi:ribonuclease inhibitor
MAVVTLEGSQIKTEADFHRLFAEALKLDSHYGENLDAMADVLSMDVERPVKLEWKDAAVSARNLGERYKKIVEVLRDTQNFDKEQGWDERFEFELL